MNYFGNVKFDVIVGNPPFNPPKTTNLPSANKIWPKFIEMAFELVKDDGHILFVTPNNWRLGNFTKSVVRDAQSKMWDNTIHWYEDVRHLFDDGINIEIDAWHVQQGTHETTLPQSEMIGAMVLPRDVEMISIFKKFFAVCLGSECFVRLKGNDGRDYPVKQDEKHRYRHANTFAWTKKNKFHWFDKETSSYATKKVIINDSGSFGAWYNQGDCGLSSSASGYEVDDADAGQKLVEFFSSSLIKFVVNQTKLPSSQRLPTQLFRRIPKAITSKSWQEVFGFTDDELAIIEGKSHVSIKEAAE
jgi:hypothetical protein